MAVRTPKSPATGKFERTIVQARLDAEAAELKAEGLSYRKIAEAQGVSVMTAHDRVQRALAAVPVDAVADLRKIELERLDIAHAAAMVQLTASHPYISNGRLFEDIQDAGPIFQAINAIVKTSESRRKLLGLDAPSRVSVTVTDAMQAEIERLAAELGVNDPEAAERQ